MSEIHIEMAVEEVAKIISGAPFPSIISRSKARRVVEHLENTRAPQWLPIESAPTDGTRVLLWDTAKGGYAISGAWVVGSPDDHETFTHWQPLPTAPEVE